MKSRYHLIPSTSSSWLFYNRTLINLYENSTHWVYRTFNTCDSLLCVNVRMHDIVVCPFSTLFTAMVEAVVIQTPHFITTVYLWHYLTEKNGVMGNLYSHITEVPGSKLGRDPSCPYCFRPSDESWKTVPQSCQQLAACRPLAMLP